LGKNLFSSSGPNGTADISLNICFVALKESADIVNEGFTPKGSGTIDPSTAYNLG
jgi:hypothetical protein